MRSVAHRLAALVALVAVLACSNLGTCWLRLTAARGHECCEQDSTMKAAPQPCGSTATAVPLVEVQAPTEWVAAVPVPPVSAALERPGPAAFARTFRVLAPPLILRI